MSPDEKHESETSGVEVDEHWAELERDDGARDGESSFAMRALLPVDRSGWAIAAGYFGLLSILLVPAPVAILLGVIAIRDLRRRPQAHGMGRAIFGLLMGLAGTLGLVAMLLG